MYVNPGNSQISLVDTHKKRVTQFGERPLNESKYGIQYGLCAMCLWNQHAFKSLATTITHSVREESKELLTEYITRRSSAVKDNGSMGPYS